MEVTRKNSGVHLPLERRIESFSLLGKWLLVHEEELQNAIVDAALHNKWFTEANIRFAIKAIAEHFLDEALLRKWVSGYRISPTASPKKVALVPAGNIPLAGFHDLLCVLLTGNFALIKLSSKDNRLLPFLLSRLCAIEPAFQHAFSVTEKLKDFDAVIATGSNNSARYFEYYFGKYPHIIRKNRNAAAALTGRETAEQLQRLGNDIFLYFGLGCRNVSKLYVPRGYDFAMLFSAFEPFHTIIHHHGYKSNFDYNLTLLIMNNMPHYASDFLMLTENNALASPLASLYFEYYDNMKHAAALIQKQKNEIQCVVAECEMADTIGFGKSQQPLLTDYADGVDTMEFLLKVAQQE